MLFGPLVWWELVRLARRGQALRARILLLYALLLGIIVFAYVESDNHNPLPMFQGNATLDLPKADRFSRFLLFALLEAQLLLVAIITPAYAVAAIAQEKDRQTLSLLLTTALTDRDIVWGKAVARILFVLSAVVCGIPVLMFTQLFGDVHIELLVSGYALTIGTVIVSGAIGIYAACYAPGSRNALILAYGLTACVLVVVPMYGLFSPFMTLLLARDDPGHWRTAVASLVVQLMAAWFLLTEATKRLRTGDETAGPFPTTAFPEPPRGRPDPVLYAARETPPPPMRELGAGDPVLWKERHAKSRIAPWVIWMSTLPALLALALFLGGGWSLMSRAMQALDPHEAMRFVQNQSRSPDYAGLMLMVAGVIAAGVYLVPLAIGVTDTIAGERLRHTLDSLLTTSLDRRRMLWAKIRAQAEHRLGFAVWAAASLGAGFGAEGGVPLGFALVATFAGGIALVIGLGAWLTVRCKNPVRAFRLCLPATVGVGSLPVLAWFCTDWANPAATVEVLAWCAAALLLAGAAMWWRAGVELERGE